MDSSLTRGQTLGSESAEVLTAGLPGNAWDPCLLDRKWEVLRGAVDQVQELPKVKTISMHNLLSTFFQK